MGGYIIAGKSSSTNGNVTENNGYEDFWIVKLSTNGEIKWDKNLGGSRMDIATSVYETSDGGCIVAGSASTSNGFMRNSDMWVVKLYPMD